MFGSTCVYVYVCIYHIIKDLVRRFLKQFERNYSTDYKRLVRIVPLTNVYFRFPSARVRSH
jgi:hypothetical protein